MELGAFIWNKSAEDYSLLKYHTVQSARSYGLHNPKLKTH
jgi:hypothetical protein